MKKRMIDHKDLSKIHGFRGDVKKPWLNTYYSVVTESNFFSFQIFDGTQRDLAMS